MSDACVVLHDPQSVIEAELPLDRAPHEALVTAVLARTTPALACGDYAQIALQLTGHAHALVADVQLLPAATAAARSPTSSWARPASCWPPRWKAPPTA